MIVPPLSVIDLILTSACNLRCAYCYQDAHPAGRLDGPALESALKRALDSPTEEVNVNFLGGEPLLEREALRRAVRYLEERRDPGKVFHYGVTTNGTRLGEEDLDFFDRHRFLVRLSFDGPPALQDQRAPGTFAKLDRLLDLARLRYPDMWRRRWRIQTVFTTATLPHLAEAVRYFLEKDVAELRIYPSIVPDPGWSGASGDELRRQLLRIYRASRNHWRLTGRIPIEFLRSGPGRPGGPDSNGSIPPARESDRALCGVGSGRNLTVDVNGETYGCPTFIHSCHTHSTSPLARRIAGLGLGRIDAVDLDERRASQPGRLIATGLFHSQRTKYSSYGRCGECPFADACMVCPVSIARIPGNSDPDRIPDPLCAFNRMAVSLQRRFAAARTRAAKDRLPA